MAIPKTLKVIKKEIAIKTIAKHLHDGTGSWEGSPNYSDFVYKCGNGYKLIRPPCGPWGDYETGNVSM